MASVLHKIPGVRIYPDSTQLVVDDGLPMFLHGSISGRVSNFFYIFRCMMPVFAGLYFVDEFTRDMGDDPDCEAVAADYGKHLVSLDVSSQTVVLAGSGFMAWGSRRYCVQGLFMPIFERVPTLEEVRTVGVHGWDPSRFGRWPPHLRGFIHMCDDIYWELYSREPSDLQRLVQCHKHDKHLRLCRVAAGDSFSEPREERLDPAKVDEGETSCMVSPIFREQSFEITDDFCGTSDWVGISRGDIHLGDKPFGWYYAFWKLNLDHPAFVVVEMLGSGSHPVGAIGARVTRASEPLVEFVGERELPWGSGRFDSFIDPDQYLSFANAQAAAAMVPEIVKSDLGLYKTLVDPTLVILA